LNLKKLETKYLGCGNPQWSKIRAKSKNVMISQNHFPTFKKVWVFYKLLSFYPNSMCLLPLSFPKYGNRENNLVKE